jgi:Fic family protein
MSLWLSNDCDTCYDALSHVRDANDLGHWINFFLNGGVETASNGHDTFSEILKLRNQVDDKIISLGRGAQNARKLVVILYTKPIATAAQVAHHLDLGPKTAFTLIEKLMSLGILDESSGKQRNRLFVFTDYLNLYTYFTIIYIQIEL